MPTVSTVAELRSLLKPYSQHKIGFVPTMGALHDGHLSLIKASHEQCDITVVSIFVNPTQFAPHEDFDAYPRHLQQDCDKIQSLAKESILFTPTRSTVYPNKPVFTQVSVPSLSQLFCGISRPHFFDGVCDVVLRLFNIVQPTMAFFGEKDFQQVTIIKTMVSELFMPIKIITCPIVRETNGLAMSSRNQYLSASQKQEAGCIYTAFLDAKEHVSSGIFDITRLKERMKTIITQNKSITIDYVAIVNASTLKEEATCNTNSRILFAGTLNSVRLIDNMSLS